MAIQHDSGETGIGPGLVLLAPTPERGPADGDRDAIAVRAANPAFASDHAEELVGRRAAASVALARLDELAEEEWTYDDTIERMRGMYRYRSRRFAARAGEGDDDGDGIEHRSLKYQKVVRVVIDAQRAELVRLRNAGDISNEVMHRLERELDLEEERLEI